MLYFQAGDPRGSVPSQAAPCHSPKAPKTSGNNSHSTDRWSSTAAGGAVKTGSFTHSRFFTSLFFIFLFTDYVGRVWLDRYPKPGRTPQHPFRGMNELTAANGEICVEFISGSNLRPARSVNKTAKILHLCPTLHINQQANLGGGGQS